MRYLSTLAARALDQPQPIRPRLPALFEPAAGPRVNFREVTVAKTGQQHQRKSARPQEQTAASGKSAAITPSIGSAKGVGMSELMAVRVDDGPPAIKSFSESVQTSAEQPKWVDDDATVRPKAPRPIDTANESTDGRSKISETSSSFPEAIKPTVQVAQAITIEQTNVIESAVDSSFKLETPKPKSADAEAPRAQSIVVKPEVIAGASEPIVIEPELLAPDPLPSVQITIGRVEVRAIMPPAQSTVTVARQPAMKALSLDEYLKQRNGEHR